jgi:hypothetical protein
VSGPSGGAAESKRGWADIEAGIRDHAGRPRAGEELPGDLRAMAKAVRVRPAPPMPDSHYPAVEHGRMHAMVNDGAAPDAVGQVAALCRRIGADLAGFQRDMTAAVTGGRANWHGPAGEQARQFMAALAGWAGSIGAGATLAGAQAERQATVLATAKSTMLPPAEFDVDAANDRLQELRDPLLFLAKAADDQAAFEAGKRTHQHAVHVLNTLDAGLAAATALPAVAGPPVMRAPAPPARPPARRPGPPPNGRIPPGHPGRTPRGAPVPAQGPGPGGPGPGARGRPPGPPGRAMGPPPAFGPGGGGFGPVGSHQPSPEVDAPSDYHEEPVGGPDLGGGEPRKRPSYLVEPDYDEMFGADRMTAPPVIE